MSVPMIKVCRDCDRRFLTNDPDVVMCLRCLRALMVEDDPEADFRAEYAEEIAALPPGERRRLLTNAWPREHSD
jgi:hypothetical protein